MGMEGIPQETGAKSTENTAEILKKEPQITKVEMDHAEVYVHYGNHNVRQEIPADLPVDAFALEFAGINFERLPDRALDAIAHDFIDNKADERMPSLRPALERAEVHHSPIAFIDVPFMTPIVNQELSKRGNVGDYDLVKIGLKISTLGLLGGMVKNLVELKNSEEKPVMARRAFLKGAGAGLAGMLVSKLDSKLEHAQQADQLVRQYDSNDPEVQEQRRMAQRLSETLFSDRHTFTHIYRNLIWAQKVGTLSNTSLFAEADIPKISLVVGAAHTGVEQALQMDEEDRLKVIEKLATKLAEIDETRLPGTDVISILQKRSPEAEGRTLSDDVVLRSERSGWDFMYVKDKKLEAVLDRVMAQRHDTRSE